MKEKKIKRGRGRPKGSFKYGKPIQQHKKDMTAQEFGVFDMKKEDRGFLIHLSGVLQIPPKKLYENIINEFIKKTKDKLEVLKEDKTAV